MINKLAANIAIMEPRNGIEEKLALARRENRSLIVKLGFDPTAPDLHLGHAVVLEKLKNFQDNGHKVVVIIGDFTARIGDPTGRNKMRPPLSAQQIDLNAKTYVSQLGKVLDVSRIEVRRNSEWLDRMNLAETIKLLSNVTVAQIMQRDDFKKRFEGNLPIAFHELVYPIMQGYDSIMIGADVEIGGTDQLFNCLMGRTLQEAWGMSPQTVICMPLLVGLDGKEKMSKSKNNYIGLTEEPENMFGKAMSISDESLPTYLQLGTMFDCEMQAELMESLISGDNPMLVKKAVARNIVERFYGPQAAQAATTHFERNVQKREFLTEDLQAVSIAWILGKLSPPFTIVDISAALVPEFTKSEIRRLVHGGAVRVSGKKAESFNEVLDVKAGVTLQVGKRRIFRFE